MKNNNETLIYYCKSLNESKTTKEDVKNCLTFIKTLKTTELEDISLKDLANAFYLAVKFLNKDRVIFDEFVDLIISAFNNISSILVVTDEIKKTYSGKVTLMCFLRNLKEDIQMDEELMLHIKDIFGLSSDISFLFDLKTNKGKYIFPVSTILNNLIGSILKHEKTTEDDYFILVLSLRVFNDKIRDNLVRKIGIIAARHGLRFIELIKDVSWKIGDHWKENYKYNHLFFCWKKDNNTLSVYVRNTNRAYFAGATEDIKGEVDDAGNVIAYYVEYNIEIESDSKLYSLSECIQKDSIFYSKEFKRFFVNDIMRSDVKNVLCSQSLLHNKGVFQPINKFVKQDEWVIDPDKNDCSLDNTITFEDYIRERGFGLKQFFDANTRTIDNVNINFIYLLVKTYGCEYDKLMANLKSNVQSVIFMNWAKEASETDIIMFSNEYYKAFNTIERSKNKTQLIKNVIYNPISLSIKELMKLKNGMKYDGLHELKIEIDSESKAFFKFKGKKYFVDNYVSNEKKYLEGDSVFFAPAVTRANFDSVQLIAKLIKKYEKQDESLITGDLGELLSKSSYDIIIQKMDLYQFYLNASTLAMCGRFSNYIIRLLYHIYVFNLDEEKVAKLVMIFNKHVPIKFKDVIIKKCNEQDVFYYPYEKVQYSPIIYKLWSDYYTNCDSSDRERNLSDLNISLRKNNYFYNGKMINKITVLFDMSIVGTKAKERLKEIITASAGKNDDTQKCPLFNCEGCLLTLGDVIEKNKIRAIKILFLRATAMAKHEIEEFLKNDLVKEFKQRTGVENINLIVGEEINVRGSKLSTKDIKDIQDIYGKNIISEPGIVKNRPLVMREHRASKKMVFPSEVLTSKYAVALLSRNDENVLN